MKDPLIYNVPLDLVDKYRDRRVIVRTAEPARLAERLPSPGVEDLLYVQILALDADLSVFATWGLGVPVDLVMSDPAIQFAKLYELGKLLEKRPVRITVPVRNGFSKSVKVASSLGVPVKIIIGQPDPENLEEIAVALDMYLHKATHSQPIEFFQETFLSFLNEDGNHVWAIQEEDPAVMRYVDDRGKEVPPRSDRSGSIHRRVILTFVDDLYEGLVAENRECASCEFAKLCKGYFKVPNRDYVCEGGVKNMFRQIRSAAYELRSDLRVFSLSAGGYSS